MMATAAVGLSLVLDSLFGEFPERVHPVSLFGTVVELFDREWQYPRAAGAVLALVLPVGVAMVAGGSTALAVQWSHVLGALVAGLFLFSTTSLRLLVSTARGVIDASTADIDSARQSAIALVGRDTERLSPGEIRSAAIESASENLADGLVAPLFAFTVGAQFSLAVGVAGAVWVKAVNTLDSMVGYRSRPLGWASARLDDIVMWVPARLTAMLIAVAGVSGTAPVRARSWCREPQSPNSGWPMATLAAVLDVRLEKPGSYVLNPAAELPTVEQSHAGVRTVAVAGVLSFSLAGAAVWAANPSIAVASLVPFSEVMVWF